MYRFRELFGIGTLNIGLLFNVLSFNENLSIITMAKEQKPNYLNTEIKKVSESDLKKALTEVNKKNKDIRESFRMDKDTLAFRAGR